MDDKDDIYAGWAGVNAAEILGAYARRPTDKKQIWSFDKIYESGFTIDEMIKVLDFLERIMRKYPNAEYLEHTQKLIRNEICNIFNGEILDK